MKNKDLEKSPKNFLQLDEKCNVTIFTLYLRQQKTVRCIVFLFCSSPVASKGLSPEKAIFKLSNSSCILPSATVKKSSYID